MTTRVAINVCKVQNNLASTVVYTVPIGSKLELRELIFASTFATAAKYGILSFGGKTYWYEAVPALSTRRYEVFTTLPEGTTIEQISESANVKVTVSGILVTPG